MNKNLLSKITNYLNDKKFKSRQHKIFIGLAMIVVFVTVYVLMMPAITMGETLICTKEEHAHTEDCYKQELICDESSENINDESCYKKTLTCTKEEHTHTQSCYSSINNDEVVINNKVEYLTSLINTIPTVDELYIEIDEMFEADATSDEIEAYYNSVIDSANTAYNYYNEMDSTSQEQITNIDKILEYQNFGLIGETAAGATTYAEVTDSKSQVTFTIKYQNTYDFTTAQAGNGTVFGFTTSKKTLSSLLSSNSFFYPFTIIIAQQTNGNLFKVTSINKSFNTNRSGISIPANSMVFMVSKDDNTGSPTNSSAVGNVEVGDIVVVSLNNDSLTGTAKSNSGVGTVKFVDSDGTKKTSKTNQGLTILESADTRELIEVNLYDYGTNINTMYNSDKNYPGFQQPGGTTVTYADDILPTDSGRFNGFNFGDIIASDIVGTVNINKDGTGINGLVSGNPANRPVSGTMSSTLVNGYPALANGNSLSYLFSNGTYAKKQNTQSINGLFQYNKTTGAYEYNSRENHAQYNASNDTFTLYDEMISSNYIQYPFGNFLPFNNIVTQTTKASNANQEYIENVIDWAIYKANHTTDTTLKNKYIQLYETLLVFDSTVKNKSGSYDSTYSAAELTKLFLNAMKIPETNANTVTALDTILEDVYTIDFDEKTNFFFGLDMSMNFMQPKGGKTGISGNENMRYYFTGDDDVWVYIDGILFLDLSGIHRHVGGEIDFVNGKVYYYDLDPTTGDVPDLTDPEVAHAKAYKVVTFEEILGSSANLNSNGTFKDYSTHTFKFYYMERGAGSGVMRMNFNMPLLKHNTISVSKELTVDEGEITALGNPNFSFQVLKATTDNKKTSELFILPNTSYDIYDENGNKVGSGVTDEYGVFTIKAGQMAVFSGIEEDDGKYYVRELLDNDWKEQYKKVTVEGSSVTIENNIQIGEDTFQGIESDILDISSGSTSFKFDNHVETNKYGSIGITKNLTGYQGNTVNQEFIFTVTLDGINLPAGTEYTVIDSNGNSTTKTITSEGTNAGKIVINATETAIIKNILSGTKYKITEDITNNGYTVTYIYNGTISQAAAEGVVIPSDNNETNETPTVSVDVNNQTLGNNLSIPVTKTITNPNDSDYQYLFELVEVTDETGTTEKYPNDENLIQGNNLYSVEQQIKSTILNGSITVTNTTTNNELFTLTYLRPNYKIGTTKHYYKIVEINEGDEFTKYDNTYYVVEVTVTNGEGNIFTSSITNIYSYGENALENPSRVEFKNTLLSDLTIKKTVKNNESTSGEFIFRITIQNQDGTPVTGTFNYEKINKDNQTTVGNYSFSKTENETLVVKTIDITLANNESITIKKLPAGTKYTIEELTTDGYVVKHKIDSGTTQSGEIASSNLLKGSNMVEFINISGYELPATGSSGMLILLIIGQLLLIVPVIYIGYTFYKEKRSMA